MSYNPEESVSGRTMVWQFQWRLEGAAVFHVNSSTPVSFPSTRFSHPPIIAVQQLINSCWNIISMLVIWGKINDCLSIKMLREALFSSPSVNLLIYSPNQLPSWTPLPPDCWLRASHTPRSSYESSWHTQDGMLAWSRGSVDHRFMLAEWKKSILRRREILFSCILVIWE